ncbi:J domain-containing protein [Halostella sp. JP-L12]|uniref:J domain-containing protein n=1 Tax=Halostella TaxID=1843185 RepID=UPI0013CE6893|nr:MULTISPECIES: J domain-containing protein [Halostella]NHN49716.1 J domain-containing protein [Halostella sp. JP-L12]
MAVTDDRRGCEGCGRTLPVDDLYSVTMPDGYTAVCCPECREFAETAAEKQAELDQRRRACDGCGAEHRLESLSEVTLSDGTSVLCCDDCERHVPGRGGSTAAGGGESSARNGTGDAGDAAQAGDTVGGETAAVRNDCDQCRESFSVELFQVETVDGRTQAFCPDCKDEGLDDGVVRSVRMRRSEAYATLAVDGDADEEAIRDAYLEKVKRVHPDRADGSRAEFKRVKRAYDRLTD